MNEMKKRIAEALCCPGGCGARYEGIVTRDHPRITICRAATIAMFEERARDVLKAMREPTKEMVDAAMDYGWQPEPLNIGYDDAWRAMIDAALKE